MNEIIYDPRIWISPPYSKCPKCQQKTFGILGIHKSSYEKRCKNCMYPNPHRNEPSYIIPLPKISKKIIYLDQMAISNMMKVLNPNTRAYNKIDKIWLHLFEKLDKLCKMQFIICPSSSFHQKESALSPYYDAIKSMYNLLSNGIEFKNAFNLKMDQVILSLQLFLDSKPFSHDILQHDLAFNEDINFWQDHIFLTIDPKITEDQIELARKQRDEISEEFNKELFEKWQASSKSFQEFFDIEEKATFQIVIEDYMEYAKEQSTITEEERFTNLLHFDIPVNVILFNTIHDIIKKQYSDLKISLQTTIDFIKSANFKSLPSHKISSYMFAGLARKATHGQKRPPSKGMLNDINIISDYLPFCDSMFLNNECIALLTENPTCDYIKNFNTRLYSKNSINSFLEYLNDIENNATPDHINKLKEVYGDSWGKPYTTLYSTKGE